MKMTKIAYAISLAAIISVTDTQAAPGFSAGGLVEDASSSSSSQALGFSGNTASSGKQQIASRGWGGGRGSNGASGSLSDAEALTLEHMREEEKLARDVYLTLYGTWEQSVFDNISGAEQRHMNAMGNKIERYGLVDPVVDDSVGVFQTEEFASLYQELTEKGATSLEDALYVGGLIEELDILDLQRAIEESEHGDIINAYENLMRGSRNHLRAFVAQIENLGLVYEAQLMTQEEVDAIANSPIERGGAGR